MTNERLRSQIGAAGLSVADLAHRIEVDTKTVERWITKERLPHRRHRTTTAELLGVDEAYLWPAVLDDVRTKSASEAELVTLYPHRGAVPDHLWATLINGAEDSVDILVYAGLFLVDSHQEGFTKTLAAKARRGTRARFIVGDPGSEAVERRGLEEGIGDSPASRIRLTLEALVGWNETEGLELRMHTTPLYNSIYRFDDDMLVNVHAYGSQAPHSPVMHLKRIPGGRMFDHFLRSFERVWESAVPATTATT